jgi:hypothetical protein
MHVVLMVGYQNRTSDQFAYIKVDILNNNVYV